MLFLAPAAVAAHSGPTAALLNALGPVGALLGKNPILTGGAAMGLLGGAFASAKQLPRTAWRWIMSRVTVTVEVPSTDPAFDWLETWLDAHPYSKRARRVTVATSDQDDDSDGALPRHIVEFAPAPGVHWFRYGRRWVMLSRVREEGKDSRYDGSRRMKETLYVRMLGFSQAGPRQLVDEARELATRRNKRPRIYTSATSHWIGGSAVPRRPLASVVFPAGTQDALLADVERFLASEEWYASHGVPYRRGYLFHGPPGTGKSSAIVALANHLNRPIYVVNVGSPSLTDERLMELLSYVPSGALLTLEDVDAAAVNREDEDEQIVLPPLEAKDPKDGKGVPASGELIEEEDDDVVIDAHGTAHVVTRRRTSRAGVTLSGLLNALDGVAAREGRITVMTSNYPERLDPALVRPGRVDRRIELTYATPYQVRGLFERFFPDSPALADAFVAAVSGWTLTPATLQEHFVFHRDDPEGAVADVATLGPES